MNSRVHAGIRGQVEGDSMEIRQILAPTDFSEFSMQAVESALAWAQTFGAKLFLLHVIELPAYPIDGFMPPSVGTTLLEDLERQASVDLAQVLPNTAQGTVEVIRQVVVGNPYSKIIEMAATEKVDLIVMATHGRTGLSHLVMGSVAERVVRTAPCAVLTMRPTHETT